MAERNIRIFVVDGVRAVRDELCQLIDASDKFILAGRAGSLAEAVRKLEDSEAQVLLLDLDLHELDDLTLLKRFCDVHPEIKVLGTGNKWEDPILRPAFGAGVSGYINKPFEEWQLAQSMKELFGTAVESKETVFTEKQTETGHVVLLLSPKRGVGQTTLAVNTAMELAYGEHGRVCLWDADLHFGDAALLLNVMPRASVIDLNRELEGLTARSATAFFTPYGDNLWLLAPPMRPEQAELMTGKDMKAVLEFLKKTFRYVVIDAAAGFHANALALLPEIDQLVFVTEVEGIAPELHLSTARRIVTEIGVGSERQILALNRIRTQDLADVNRFQTENGKLLTFFFPNDYPAATASLNSGEPVVRSKPESQLGRAVSQFAELLLDREKKTHPKHNEMR